jgi:hypothetical protein
MLEASIATEDEREEGFLAGAIASHRSSQIKRARREEHEARPMKTLRDWRKAFSKLDEAGEETEIEISRPAATPEP